MRTVTPDAFLDHLKRCDICGRSPAVDPILRLIDLDETRLLCEIHAAGERADFTPQAAVAQAAMIISLDQGRMPQKRAA